MPIGIVPITFGAWTGTRPSFKSAATGGEWIDADQQLAFDAGSMIAKTRRFGLSLGDRFCLALVLRRNEPAMAADQRWREVTSVLGVEIEVIR